MNELDFSALVDVVTSGDGALIAVAAVLAAAVIGLKLAGKKVPVLGRAATALLKLIKISKPQAELPKSPSSDEAPKADGISSVIPIKKG